VKDEDKEAIRTDDLGVGGKDRQRSRSRRRCSHPVVGTWERRLYDGGAVFMIRRPRRRDRDRDRPWCVTENEYGRRFGA